MLTSPGVPDFKNLFLKWTSWRIKVFTKKSTRAHLPRSPWLKKSTIFVHQKLIFLIFPVFPIFKVLCHEFLRWYKKNKRGGGAGASKRLAHQSPSYRWRCTTRVTTQPITTCRPTGPPFWGASGAWIHPGNIGNIRNIQSGCRYGSWAKGRKNAGS